MDVATYRYYEKVRRMMHNAIVSYLLKRELYILQMLTDNFFIFSASRVVKLLS